MSKRPVAFMSYDRFADKHDRGQLTDFCEYLSGEVQMQTGEEFRIFQDRTDVSWGEQQTLVVNNTLEVVTFLIPIIMPGFFNSGPCCTELTRFLERERKLGRTDLVLPVYYVDCPAVNTPPEDAVGSLPSVIAARQHFDWRKLRLETKRSKPVRKAFARMAIQIRDALERGAVKSSGDDTTQTE